MQVVSDYVQGIYRARHFWWHLAKSDIRSRWRRSSVGMLWSLLQPLGLALLIAYVFSNFFNSDLTTLLPYILSGIVIWEAVSASVMNGCTAFIMAEAYIKQTHHPLAIYSLRLALGALVNLSVAILSFYLCTAFLMPEKTSWVWLSSLLIFPILLLLLWPIATLMAYIATRFRDVPHAMGLVLQAIWFLSPVYFEERIFRQGGLDALIDYNPVYHLLQIVREPVLQGRLPDLHHITVCLLTAAGLTLITILVGLRAEKRVIFYL